MKTHNPRKKTSNSPSSSSGYGSGTLKTVISVDDVVKEVSKISSQAPTLAMLKNLAHSGKSPAKSSQRRPPIAHSKQKTAPKRSTKQKVAATSSNEFYLTFSDIIAGYGNMTILSNFNLFLNKGQSLCLIGPNGAGKSTILHTLYGLTRIFNGKMTLAGRDVTNIPPNEKLRQAKIAYLLQENSVFSDMTIEENLLMGGFLMPTQAEAYATMEEILNKYTRLKARRNQKASVLSGGERRLLEISRALMMQPDVLLIDEPSIGLEPRFIDMVFEILAELRDNEHKTILMVEQNAKKGLEFSDLAYVLVNGQIALAGSGNELLKDPRVGRLFLGG